MLPVVTVAVAELANALFVDAQLMHAVIPGLGATEPAAQVVGHAALAAQDAPAGHAIGAVANCGQKLPAGHGEHALAPADEKLPEHGVGEAAPEGQA
jgi:hypothetical protein